MGWFRVYLCGIAMGIAELIPGISGGTIAFIAGIYQRLVRSIGYFNLSQMWALAQLPFGIRKPKAVLATEDAWFLLVLALGMVSAWLTMAHLISWLLDTQRILLWAGLFGLVFGSIIMMLGRYEERPAAAIPIAAGGFLLGFALSSLQLPSIAASPLMIIAMGGIAACAWVLPGISGSFLLLITGLYQPLINALTDANWSFLALLAVGVVVCLPMFSTWLSRLLVTRNVETMLFLTAFMLGSLKVLWPWQLTTSYFFSPHNENLPLITEPVLPQTYAAITGENPQLLGASILAISMVMLVIWLERRKLRRA